MSSPEDTDPDGGDGSTPQVTAGERPQRYQRPGPEHISSRFCSVPFRESGVAIYDRENTEAYVHSEVYHTLSEIE
jgi:hypothetical protein